MNIGILDLSFHIVYYVDMFESFIWTERYNSCGDFELYIPMEMANLEYLQKNNYVTLDDTSTVMIIETLELITNVENGDRLKVTGRSLESILDRRIIWNQTTLNGKIEGQIRKLINENVISPSISSRKISNFAFANTSDPTIAALTISAQYTGDNLYETIKSICELYAIGFKIVLNNNQFVFSLYSGVDHTSGTSYVEFSPEYDNLISSDYLESIENEKNVALIAGEGEGESRRRTSIGTASGIDRRELYVDARDIQSEDDDNPDPDSKYLPLLVERGKEKLSENTYIQTFDGDIDYSRMFILGKDYSIGDIVHISNNYGISTNVRITEIIRSYDETGYSIYPTFEVV